LLVAVELHGLKTVDSGKVSVRALTTEVFLDYLPARAIRTSENQHVFVFCCLG